MKISSNNDYSYYYKKAVAENLLDVADTTVIFYDYSILLDKMKQVADLFPASSFHTVAVKTNPLLKVLSFIVENKFGLETASFPEILLAQNLGIKTNNIVFDSPAKTQQEIDEIAENSSSIIINLNNLDELRLYKKYPQLNLGLRINPSIEVAAIDSMNVGGTFSKFGELIENKNKIIKAFTGNKNLTRLHVHSGSQIQNLAPTIVGIRKVVDLALMINKKCNNQVKTVDIGGGFPVNYNGNSYNIKTYVDELKRACPELFDNTFKIITEFGRFYHANAGWVATDVATVKHQTSHIIVQAGADMFLREAYNPTDWYHDMLILDAQGEEKKGAKKLYDVGGPLCFGGDYITKKHPLTLPKVGDKLIIKDCGANTFSLWSRHCSRPFPKVITYSSSLQGKDMKIAKKRETIAAILKFWGEEE